ncbi:MAG TPA: MFS transporter [Devosiaceae bacterium]
MMTDTRVSASQTLKLAALSLAMLLPSLGTSIANVALPALASSFDAPFQAVQWVVIAYLLSVTTLVVAAGRLGDLFGRRRLLVSGIGMFALASVACSLAPNLVWLIASRGIQGFGAALMMALTVASVGDIVPPDKTGRAMGLLGTVSAVGTALGPSLGGVLVAHYGWPSVFAVMAGTSAPALAIALLSLPAETPKAVRPLGFDGAGMLTLALALAAYALSATLQVGIGITLVLVAIAALGFIAFVRIERGAPAPMLQITALRALSVSTGLVSVALISAVVMASLVVGPFYLGDSLGLDPAAVGLIMSIGPSVAALTGIPAGHLVDRFSATPMILAGLATVVAGTVMMSVLPVVTGLAGYIGSIVLVTAGYALFQAANGTAIMTGVSREQRGVISGLLALARNLGLVTGASVMGGLFVLGSHSVGLPGLAAGSAGGLQLTFAVSALLAGIALGAVLWGSRQHVRRNSKDGSAVDASQ